MKTKKNKKVVIKIPRGDSPKRLIPTKEIIGKEGPRTTFQVLNGSWFLNIFIY